MMLTNNQSLAALRRAILSMMIFGLSILGVACQGTESEAPVKQSSSQETATPTKPTNNIIKKTFVSRAHAVQQKYKSMLGPSEQGIIYLTPADENGKRRPELLWLKGYQSRIVDGDDKETELSQEFLCHSNIDMPVKRHNEFFRLPKPNQSRAMVSADRVVTVSQGFDSVRLPEGFALPLSSHHPLKLVTQILNLNLGKDDLDKPINMRHKVDVEFMHDTDLQTPVKPLFSTSLVMYVSLEGEAAYLDTLEPTDTQTVAHCAPGEAFNEGHAFKDQHDRKFTSHWMVKPGREVRHTLANSMLGLTFDTTIHYISVHVHPYAESVALRDLTEDKILFESRMVNHKDKAGIISLDLYSSAEGIPVYKDHDYELVSVYNNTTDHDVDAMAALFVFMEDKDFNLEETRQRMQRFAGRN